MSAALFSVGALWLCAAATSAAGFEAVVIGTALTAIGAVQLLRSRARRQRELEADRLSRALFVRAARKRERGGRDW